MPYLWLFYALIGILKLYGFVEFFDLRIQIFLIEFITLRCDNSVLRSSSSSSYEIEDEYSIF